MRCDVATTRHPTVAADDPATTSGARSAAASSGGARRSTQAGEYAPEARPTSRQHQLQPPKQAAPALHRDSSTSSWQILVCHA